MAGKYTCMLIDFHTSSRSYEGNTSDINIFFQHPSYEPVLGIVSRINNLTFNWQLEEIILFILYIRAC